MQELTSAGKDTGKCQFHRHGKQCVCFKTVWQAKGGGSDASMWEADKPEAQG